MTKIYNCKYIQLYVCLNVQMFACPNFIKNSLKSRPIAYTRYLLPICAHEINKCSRALNDRKISSIRRFKKLLGTMKIHLIKWSAPN
jgi:hypothetical protein